MNIYSFIGSLLYVVPTIIILVITFRDHIKSPGYFTIVPGVALFLSMVSAFAYIYFTKNITNQITTLIVIFCMTFSVFIFNTICDFNFVQCAFVIFIAKCFMDDMHLLTIIVYYFFTGKGAKHLNLTYIIIGCILNILVFPLALLFFRRLVKSAIIATKELTFWKLFCWIPICSSLIYCLMIFPAFQDVLSENPVSKYTIAIAWIALTTLIYAILLQTILEMTKNMKLSEELHLSEELLAIQEKQISMLQEKIEESRRLKHDVRHTLVALQSYLDNKNYIQLEEYINQYISRLDNTTPVIYCNNTIVNSIVSYYVQQSRENDIDISVQIQIEDSFPLPDIDLCVVLGNLLENALEACLRQKVKKRFIKLNILSKHGSVLILVIENSYEGAIAQKDSVFFSSKKENRVGIGISSVRRIASKYHGLVNFDYTSDIFKVSLLLNAEEDRQ